MSEIGGRFVSSALEVTGFLPQQKDLPMTLGTIILIILLLMLLGVIPTWPHSRDWGYGPSGLLGTILIIVVVLVLLGRL